MIDLHVHSNKSDGTLSPSELVAYAVEKGLSAFALTDHDTTDGLQEAQDAAADFAQKGIHIEVIPGIEFSTEYEGKDIHILGLYIDYKNPLFQNKLQEFVDSREGRNKKMCDRLREEAGIDITYQKLISEHPDAVITRSHYAQYLYKHGYVKSLPEAFERYIGDHCKYFVPREKVTPVQAVELILSVKGIPVLAHPILYHFSEQKLESLTATLKEAGLIGVEAIYSTYNSREERQIRNLAAKLDLCISGGSDFHGVVKPGLDLATGYGKLYIPEEILLHLKDAAKNQKTISHGV